MQLRPLIPLQPGDHFATGRRPSQAGAQTLERVIDRLLSSPRAPSAWAWMARLIDGTKLWNAKTMANCLFCYKSGFLKEASWVSFVPRKFETMPVVEYVLRKVSWMCWSLAIYPFSERETTTWTAVVAPGVGEQPPQPIKANCSHQAPGTLFRLLSAGYNGSQ